MRRAVVLFGLLTVVVAIFVASLNMLRQPAPGAGYRFVTPSGPE